MGLKPEKFFTPRCRPEGAPFTTGTLLVTPFR